MKLTIAQIINAHSWLASMVKKEVSFKAAYLISSNVKNLEPEVKNFEEQRSAIIDKYCKKDETGNVILVDNVATFDEENKDSVNEEFAKLFECEIEVVINKIPTSEFAGMSIPPEIMFAVDFLFDAEK